MTSPATAAPTSHRMVSRTPHITGKQTFWRAVHAEWVKLRTLRSTWVTAFISILITAGIGATVTAYGADEGSTNSWYYIIVGTTFGQIVVAVLGALVVTGEYSSGQVRSTLAAVPRRSRAFWAKALVVAVWSFLLGAASILLAWIISAPFIDSTMRVSLVSTDFLSYVWGTGLAFAGIGLMSLGLGFLLRSTAGAITVVTVVLFVINIPLGIAGPFWKWAETLSYFTLAQTITHVVDPLALTTGEMPDAPINHTGSIIVTVAWFVLPLLAGWFTFAKRDA
ncbi:ABC transporter permease [Actinomyces faecalis]|uniref:ABC transporter permease n=1 Tax=Actinomyces faecalis TaxID=2722820 RepID=UPI001551D185|nr:ABC transporter permease [Actinomyces faecalis]